ncbi:MAG: DNA alkylation repair protein [Gemmatimonadaceae bacterium]|nr:DNA alkylation repair protein [Gemmatimonadaceae bacterium]
MTRSALNIAREVRATRAALAAVGSATRAVNEKAYLKSDLDFVGSDMPAIRKFAKVLIARVRMADPNSMRPLVVALWGTGVHELRAVAMFVLEDNEAALRARDIPLLTRLLRESRSWAYLDWICLKVAAPMLARVPLLRRTLPRWARDDDFWMRRAAVLTLLPGLKGGTIPFSAFEALAVPMLGEREFFIRKALGWVLREVSKANPAPVAAFLRAHRADVSGLTIREGAKYLSARQRRALLGR